MKNQRIIYLDVIRIFACLCVLIIHFNASVSGYDSSGYFVYPNHLIPNFYFGNIYLGTIGVGLFFIISGAALEHTYGNIQLKFNDIKSFYVKRFKSIYPAFWIAFFVASGISFLVHRGFPLADFKSFIASLLGLDGYLMSTIQKYYFYYQVGEWFLGCIILLYLIYPFLSFVFHKYCVLTVLGSVLLYGLSVNKVPNTTFALYIPYLLYGMWFIKNIRTSKRKDVWIFNFIILLIAYLTRSYINNFTLSFAVNINIFVIIVWISEILFDDLKLSQNVSLVKQISLLSGLTYPAFLVHHKLISYLVLGFDLSNFPYLYTCILFIIYMVLTYWLSVLLNKYSKQMTNYLTRLGL